MRGRENRISLFLGVPGLILQVVGNLLSIDSESEAREVVGLLVLIVGTALLVAGLGFYASAKGRSRWWGLFGLLPVFGLIVLASLGDHTDQA